MSELACEHDASPRASPGSTTCVDCGTADQLRVCNECGHVGCSDTQQGHTVAHASQRAHPVFREYAPPDDDGWTWCERCEDYIA